MNSVTQQITFPFSAHHPFHKSYENINFRDLDVFKDVFSDFFVEKSDIIFQEKVGLYFMTGNELLYYPELAKQIRAIGDYPVLERHYAMDEALKGIEFLQYFCRYLPECFKAFQAELEKLSTHVNELIRLYSQDRMMPLIDHVELVEERTFSSGRRRRIIQSIVVNGVSWPVTQQPYKSPEGFTERKDYIDLHEFLNISKKEAAYLFIEDFLKGTPFIQVRLIKTFLHKGHTRWYNLDTCQPVSKSDIGRWKKPV